MTTGCRSPNNLLLDRILDTNPQINPGRSVPDFYLGNEVWLTGPHNSSSFSFLKVQTYKYFSTKKAFFKANYNGKTSIFIISQTPKFHPSSVCIYFSIIKATVEELSSPLFFDVYSTPHFRVVQTIIIKFSYIAKCYL